MTDITDDQIFQAMQMFGGGFVQALGHAFSRADRMNQERIKAAFPELWESYRELVVLQRKRAERPA